MLDHQLIHHQLEHLDLVQEQQQLDILQYHLNQLADQFQQHVAAFRDVDDEAWRAGFYIGSRSVDMNLIDDIGTVSLAKEWLRSQL